MPAINTVFDSAPRNFATKWRSQIAAFSLLLLLSTACSTANDLESSRDSASVATKEEPTMTILVGTYTNNDSQGVYRLGLNLGTGQLTQFGLVAELEQPSFLAAASGLPGHFVAVHETGRFAGQPSGGLSLLRLDPTDGTATVLAQRITQGTAPCHVVFHPAGGRIAVANYSGGNYTAYRLSMQRDPSSQQPADLSADDVWLSPGHCFQNEGSSVNKQRQEAPHGHCVRFVPGREDMIVAADLGTDEVLAFKVSETKADVVLEKVGSLKMKPGCGPRQIDFHPNGKWMFVINELDNTISQVSVPNDRGEMQILSTVPTLPADFEGGNSTAHIQVHPDGRFVYGSNRGHDSIAAFRVNEHSGELTPIGHYATGGKTPRHFLVEPTGKYLLAANQSTDDVFVFHIDPESGVLQPTGFQAHVPTPVCLLPLE